LLKGLSVHKFFLLIRRSHVLGIYYETEACRGI
jgi:hypothetical protein